MKKLILSLFVLTLVFSNCKKDDDNNDEHHMTTDLDYTAKIMSPNNDPKQLDGSIHIHAIVESATKQTVHHAKIKIYNKADNTIIAYEKPDEAHVHQTDGKYELHDDLDLSTANKFTSNSDWIIEVKAWGHEAGEGEIMKKTEFHIE